MNHEEKPWIYYPQENGNLGAGFGIGKDAGVVPHARVVGDDDLNEGTAKKIVAALNLLDGFTKA